MNSYFYIDAGGKQCGPFSPDDLKNQNITSATLVWCSGMPDWTPASMVSELNFLFQPPVQTSGYGEAPAYPTPPRNSVNSNNSRNSSPLNKELPIPKTWFVESILATIFCCIPFGIVGIINANKVESLYYAGDYEGSMRASREAGKWTKIAFFLGLTYIAIIIIVYGGMLITMFSSGSSYGY